MPDYVSSQGVQTQLAAKSKGAQKAAAVLTASSSLRMKAARRFRGRITRDTKPRAPERVRRKGGVFCRFFCSRYFSSDPRNEITPSVGYIADNKS